MSKKSRCSILRAGAAISAGIASENPQSAVAKKLFMNLQELKGA